MEGELLEKFKAEGVTIVDPSPELKQSLVDASKKFIHYLSLVIGLMAFMTPLKKQCSNS